MPNRSVSGLRLFRGMTIEELAAASGVSAVRIQEMEAQMTEPTFAEAGDLAVALDATERLFMGYRPYDEEDDDFEEIRTTLFIVGGSHDYDMIISWPGLPSRRYPVSDLNRDLFLEGAHYATRERAFRELITLDNRFLAIATGKNETIEFVEPGSRPEIPAGIPFSIGLIEGIKDIVQDLEPNGTRSPRYIDQVRRLLSSLPEADDMHARFILHGALHADGSHQPIEVDDRIGALVLEALEFDADDDLEFDFDDGYGDVSVDLEDVLLIDVPAHIVLDEQIDAIEV